MSRDHAAQWSGIEREKQRTQNGPPRESKFEIGFGGQTLTYLNPLVSTSQIRFKPFECHTRYSLSFGGQCPTQYCTLHRIHVPVVHCRVETVTNSCSVSTSSPIHSMTSYPAALHEY